MITPELALQSCPCGTGDVFKECCQPYLTGRESAPTAEALMRSRYSAFTIHHVDYLLQTHFPANRTLKERTELIHACSNTTWQTLRVLDTVQGQEHDVQGVVEFVAVFRSPDLGQLHERSNFLKQSGQWFYVDGQILPPIQPKRGEPCWCGSGKKYKRCHG